MYISQQGRTNKDVSWEENSIFKEVVSNYMYKHTKNRDRISGDVRKVAKKIHDSALTTLEKILIHYICKIKLWILSLILQR